MTSPDVYRPIYANQDGQLVVAGDLLAAGANGRTIWELSPETLCPLPAQADLFQMPGRGPVAIDPRSGEAVVIEGRQDPAVALAAILPVGYTRLLLPAVEDDGHGPPLPLFGYTAVAERRGRLYAAATMTEDPRPWSPARLDPVAAGRMVAEREAEFPGNRVLAQLVRCTRDYHCCTALNLIRRRGEAGLPAAVSCNAACLGCISLQPAGCCPAPQSRIGFTPDAAELIELAVAHLEASGAIVSFGQGCEGEALTIAPLLADAIRGIRRRTHRGTINLNTNGSLPEALAGLIEAGLDSVRVSLFSAISADYEAYHRPSGFGLSEVAASLRLADAGGCRTNLNLLVFPGFTDSVQQMEASIDFCRLAAVHKLQLRNLNLDPRAMVPFLRDAEAVGLNMFLARMRQELPAMAIGSYTANIRC